MDPRFAEVLRRQLARHGDQLAGLDSDSDPDELSGLPPLSDEELAQLRAELDRNFGQGAAAALLDGYQGPMSAVVLEALDALPEGMPATADDFVEGHETMRRLVGDQRKPERNGPGDAA